MNNDIVIYELDKNGISNYIYNIALHYNNKELLTWLKQKDISSTYTEYPSRIYANTTNTTNNYYDTDYDYSARNEESEEHDHEGYISMIL